MSDQNVGSADGELSVDELKAKVATLTKTLEDRQKTVGRQGDELGSLKAELAGTKKQIEELVESLKPLASFDPNILTAQTHSQQQAKAPTLTNQTVDWDAEEEKLSRRLTTEQRDILHKFVDGATAEQTELLSTAEGRVHFLKEHVLNGQAGPETSTVKIPFLALTTQQKPDLRTQIKDMLRQERKAEAAATPRGGSAQAGNTAANNSAAKAQTTGKLPEAKPMSHQALMGKLEGLNFRG